MKWFMLTAMIGLMVAGRTVSAKEPKVTARQLQGTWVLKQVEIGGKKQLEKDFKGNTITFSCHKYTFKEPGEAKSGTFKLDTSKKPWTIDLTPSDAPDKENNTLKGIVTIEGDTLTIAVSFKGKRPTDFTSSEKAAFMVMTFTRQRN
jgi:uncharacterized protein (TIGR03067 family)